MIMMIIMHDSAIMHVDRQQKFKTYDHYINHFVMIWCREVESTQNHSFKDRYLAKFISLKTKRMLNLMDVDIST